MPKPNDKIGPYILISKLGRGAFGVVWLAEKRSVLATTKVALKLPNDEDIDLEAIKQEASLWVHASGHPNVLPIIDADIYDEQIVIVSEYAPDGSLSKWVEEHGGKAPSIKNAMKLTEGILAGLEHLHERGVIHRDLKPDNILLQRDIPRLADFGIARILKTTSNSTIATGTPSYMPPEAFDGKRSKQTDIWSVGVILYQLLTGRLPFPQAEITALIGAIVTKEPEPLPDSIPQSIQKVIQRALQKSPAERFDSASEMRKALRDAAQPQVPPSSGKAKTEVLQQRDVELPPTVISPSLVEQFEQKDELTETEQLQLDYWTAFRDFLKSHNTFLNIQKPQPQQWMTFAIGRTNFALLTLIHRKGRRISVDLMLSGPYAKPHFYLLRQDRKAVEKEIGAPLEWRELAKGKESHIRLNKYKTDPANRQDWYSQHEWLKEKLELFHKEFAPRIKNLNASDYVLRGEDEANSQQIIPAIASTVASPTALSSIPSTEPALLTNALQHPRPLVQPKRRSRLWIVGIIFAGLLAGIIIILSNSNTGDKTTTNAPSSNPTTSSPASPTTANVDKVGVAECDDYLAKYEACLSKVPEAARAQLYQAVTKVRKSWRDLAANPQTKSTLAQACKMANDQAKQSMKPYGCDF